MTPEGLHVIGADEYHRDPCPEPSLSSTIARVLLAQSPAHAWWNHPRLNPSFAEEDERSFDLGTVAHALLLEGVTSFAVIEAADWRTKAAKKARAEAIADGLMPILDHQVETVQAMVKAARHQLLAFSVASEGSPPPFTNGVPERTLVWMAGGLWCRARLDWLHNDHRWIDDYKTTTGSANPEVWSRTLFASGYDVQAAFYLRAVKAVLGREAAFRFVVQETEPPYALSVIALAPDALDLAHRKVETAIAVWRKCLTANDWPAYPVRTCYAEAPPWDIARWMEREARDWTPPPPAIMDDGRPIADLLFGKEGA